MNLPVNDARNLAVGLLDPASGKFYNATTDALEAFDPTKHLRTLAPIAVQVATPVAPATWTLPATLWTNLKNTDAGAALVARPNLVPVWFVMDTSGDVLSITDVWPNPIPVGLGVFAGGYGR